MAYKVTAYSSLDRNTATWEFASKEELFASLKQKSEKWIPFLDKDSFQSIELISGDDSAQFRYKIEKI